MAAASLREALGCGEPERHDGIAVLGLLLVALGAMRGMRGEIASDLLHAVLLLGLGFAVNAGLQVIGALIFAGLECRRALTVGLVSGNRNITLVWAAAAPFLADRSAVELFLAMSVFPILMLPAVTRRALSVLMEREGGFITAIRPVRNT